MVGRIAKLLGYKATARESKGDSVESHLRRDGERILASCPDSQMFTLNGPRPLPWHGHYLRGNGVPAVEVEGFDQAVDGRPLHIQAL